MSDGKLQYKALRSEVVLLALSLVLVMRKLELFFAM
jgi:hypothetical protein